MRRRKKEYVDMHLVHLINKSFPKRQAQALLVILEGEEIESRKMYMSLQRAKEKLKNYNEILAYPAIHNIMRGKKKKKGI